MDFASEANLSVFRTSGNPKFKLTGCNLFQGRNVLFIEECFSQGYGDRAGG
jgi:hypothetical protein